MAKNSNKKEFSNPPQKIDRLFYDYVLDDYQLEYANAIWNPDTVSVVVDSKAGTGKTTIACGVANMLVQYGMYDSILYIAAPTQEQKQGYLPGTIEDKSMPYFEPMIEAMIACGMNPNVALANDINNQKNGTAIVECVTHTYLRGINVDKKVVIIDEAQNYYLDELKKTLTRIKDSCKVVIIGHIGQIDLYKNRDNSGFAKYKEYFARKVKKDDPRLKICKLVNNYRGWFSNLADNIDNDDGTYEDDDD